MKAKKERVCGCGHEQGRHALVDVDGVQKHIGPCSHLCRCAGFHRRRRSHTITDPGVLDLVTRSYPAPVVRDAISVSTGYKPSTRNAYIQRLEKKKLVVLPNKASVAASPHLFTKKAKKAS